MTPDDAARVVRSCLSEPEDAVVEPAGSGDYCDAYRSGGWIFLFARTGEAKVSLARVAAVLPRIEPGLPAPVPVPLHAGPGFIGYRRLEGRRLDGRLGRAVADLAAFVRTLHATDLETAAEVPVCEYAFAATEDGLRTGPAKLEYGRDLERLASAPAAVLAVLERSLREHLAEPAPRVVLLHGELSREHILVGGRGRVSGVFDFNGMIVGDPARDLLYLYEEVGEAFVVALLELGCLAEPTASVLARLRFLRLWHTALRWLWLVEHGYDAASRLDELRALAA